LFAYDQTTGKPSRPADAYFLEAIERIRSNRRTYARRRAPRFSELQIGFRTE